MINKNVFLNALIIFCILWYTNIGFSFYNSFSGVEIEQYEEKKCAEKWVINTLETNAWEINEIANEEKIKGMPAIQIRLMFSKLLPCISNVQIYNNTKMKRNNTVAYVAPHFKSNMMWVISDKWNKMGLENRAYCIIHECTHLALKTLDYAYVDEEKYSNLRGYNATNNADTLSNIVYKTNINTLC